jgi:hypothetical protein
MIIKKQQFVQINDVKFQEYVVACQKLIEDEHPEVYKTRAVGEWKPFILSKIKAAMNYGIVDPENMFIFVLTLAEFPQYFHPRMPQWAIDNLTWPERNEEDKIILLCKEVNDLNQLSS